MKRIYLIIFLLIVQCSSKLPPRPIEILFDYSNLINIDEPTKKIIKKEFDIVGEYMKNLFQYHQTPDALKNLIRAKRTRIKCDNKDTFSFKRKDIKPYTTMLVIPKIIINSRTKNSIDPVLNKCKKKGNKILVIGLTFHFKSIKVMKRAMINNLNNLNIQWIIIRHILSSLGFNKDVFSKRKIVSNVFIKIKNSDKFKFRTSFKKFVNLTNYKIQPSKKKGYYLNYWPSLPLLSDIMKSIVYNRRASSTVTEMTLDMMELLGYKVSPCELLLYKNKCYRVNQQCLTDWDYDKYFLHYALDDKNKRWICYYKTNKHFKNLQCSSDYGILLRPEEVNDNLLSNYLRAQDFQKIVMLKPSTLCPKPHPRTLYYMSVKPKEDPYQYKFVEGTEEVIIKNPRYFVITNTFSTTYNAKYFAANYNGVYANKTKGWNYNYFWSYFDKVDSSASSLYQIENKYQKIGKFPLDHTYKDGLNRFYNKQKEKFPNDYNYIPETFLYPDQKKLIFEKFHNYHYDPKDVWLFKPARDSFGNGVHIIDNYTDIEKTKIRNFLITRYIMNPLMIKNKKFDMRAYVLVTGMNPLKIYFYKDGYLKIPVKNFTLDHEYINEGCVHITTSDTNLECFEGKEYKYDTDIYDESSNFWSYVFFERYCQRYGINYTDIIEQFKDIFIKTFISLNSDFIKLINENNLKDRNLYQIYGLDLLVDDNYKVHLLELNRSPSMRGGHAVADYIYENIIADTLNIVGIVPFAHDNTQEPMDRDIYYYNNITEEIVDDCLCEFSRPRGAYELIYPLKDNINKYRKFYEKITPESELFWNKLLESNGEYN